MSRLLFRLHRLREIFLRVGEGVAGPLLKLLRLHVLRKILLLSAGVAEEVVSKKGCSRLLPKLLAREVPNEGKGCSSPLPRLKHSLTLWPSIPRCPPLADIYRPCFTKKTFLIFLSKRVAVTSVQVLAKCFCKIFGENEGLHIDESGPALLVYCICAALHGQNLAATTHRGIRVW